MTSQPVKQLSDDVIRTECSNSSFQRGKSYFDAKRVTDLRKAWDHSAMVRALEKLANFEIGQKA